MVNPRELRSYIFEDDEAISPEWCKEVVARFEADDRKMVGATVGGENPKIKQSTDLPIASYREEWNDVLMKVTSVIQKGLADYIEYLNSEGLDRYEAIAALVKDSCIGFPQIQRTGKDQFYVWHHDGHINRTYTYIIYLKDVPKGVGGTTEFLCGKNVLPKAGKLVIFPSNACYVHRGVKLKKGTKYLLTNFVYEGKPILSNPSDQHVRADGDSETSPGEQYPPKPENNDI